MQFMMAHVCSPQLVGLTLHPAISLTQSHLRCRTLCTNGRILACPLVWKRGLLNGRSLGFSLGVTPLKKAASGVRCSWNPIALVRSNQAKQAASVVLKAATSVTIRAHQAFQADPLIPQVAYALVIIMFSVWVLGPILRTVRHRVFKRDDRRWKDSQTRYVLSSYLRPVFLWVGVILLCRAFDPVVLSTEASQAIKHRFLNFVRSLSTVVVFAYCTASLSRQLQKLTMEHQSLENSRNVGVQFIGNAVYSAVWVAAVCLFMELLGFSTQKWLTAGGLGTVLLTLAGREIFTNFLSGVMIHATRPFVENEWIQSKIEGYEVSGTVEQVGWWSPTIIRGDDREAVHIPNHKFTVSVVRNLTQKSHWRIKSHLCISHLDVNKIPNIVADMRKVLGKHPQVEQKRLHRRVFLENVNAENQALMILVSCFVKTSHFEEYLRVKEVILLDLLKVISHHRARLATPIRSVQRVMDDSESRHSPFRDMTSRAANEARERPILLLEATASTVDRKEEMTDATPSRIKEDQVEATAAPRSPSSSKQPLEGLDSMGLNSKDITLLGAAFEKPPANITDDPQSETPKASTDKVTDAHSEVSTPSLQPLSAVPTERYTPPSVDGFQENSTKLDEVEDAHTSSPPAPTRPQLGDNLVLGVAIDGPKRILPLDHESSSPSSLPPPSPSERELVASRNGNTPSTTTAKESSETASSKLSPSSDSREKER